MSAAGRLAAFAAVLAGLFAGAALLGELVGQEREATADRSHAAGDGAHREAGDSEPQRVRGLAVADRGLRLVVEDPELRRGRTRTLVFRIVDARGETVRDVDVTHERRMHTIVVRRDLTGFQHVHPEQAADGAWSVPLRLDAPGSYRLFADFSHEGEAVTLATDLSVDGPAQLRALPAPSATAVSDRGDDVRLEVDRAGAGEEARLRFAITRGGAPVRPQPYLGAGGHLVALRAGDLAFLHVHPTEAGRGAAPAVGFAATFPTPGGYRLFLQYRHAGRVRTVAFTHEVPQA